jgi:hypothetical protein
VIDGFARERRLPQISASVLIHKIVLHIRYWISQTFSETIIIERGMQPPQFVFRPPALNAGIGNPCGCAGAFQKTLSFGAARRPTLSIDFEAIHFFVF